MNWATGEEKGPRKVPVEGSNALFPRSSMPQEMSETLPKSAQSSRKGSSPLYSHDFSESPISQPGLKLTVVAKVSFASRVQGLQVWLTTPSFI